MAEEQLRQVNLARFPTELYRRLKKIAASHRRPVSQEIIWALERYADRIEKEIKSGVTYQVDDG